MTKVWSSGSVPLTLRFLTASAHALLKRLHWRSAAMRRTLKATSRSPLMPLQYAALTAPVHALYANVMTGRSSVAPCPSVAI
ncbi:hypothetical protein GFB64_11675 [Lacticaseibacillus paracasei]|nr:hypothetical protein GFB64_11675 [Lacticaseibacillus paracasei]